MDLLERTGQLSRNAFAHARNGCIGCGSPIFLLDDWGGDHWLPQIGLQSPGHGSTLLTWSVGAISSDYCHGNHSMISESSALYVYYKSYLLQNLKARAKFVHIRTYSTIHTVTI